MREKFVSLISGGMVKTVEDVIEGEVINETNRSTD